VDGSHLNLIRAHDGQPESGIAVATRQAASGYALRALPRRKTYTTSWDINAAIIELALVGLTKAQENRGRL
jgi:hypothetical protein